VVLPCLLLLLLLRLPVTAVPKALDRYAEIADALVLGGSTKEEKVRETLLSMLLCLSCHAFGVCVEIGGCACNSLLLRTAAGVFVLPCAVSC
jgi:hypothetical protein